MDNTEHKLEVQLAVLQSLVSQGFDGLNKRLDTLNGRVYTGEKGQSELRERLVALETLHANQPPPPPSAGTGKAVAAGGGAAGVLLAIWELVKPFFQH
jgi:hypothetical protein